MFVLLTNLTNFTICQCSTEVRLDTPGFSKMRPNDQTCTSTGTRRKAAKAVDASHHHHHHHHHTPHVTPQPPPSTATSTTSTTTTTTTITTTPRAPRPRPPCSRLRPCPTRRTHPPKQASKQASKQANKQTSLWGTEQKPIPTEARATATRDRKGRTQPFGPALPRVSRACVGARQLPGPARVHARPFVERRPVRTAASAAAPSRAHGRTIRQARSGSDAR